MSKGQFYQTLHAKQKFTVPQRLANNFAIQFYQRNSLRIQLEIIA